MHVKARSSASKQPLDNLGREDDDKRRAQNMGVYGGTAVKDSHSRDLKTPPGHYYKVA